MLPPNTLLHRRYTIVRQLGQGGMGAVYLATDQTFGSTVALKETLITDDTLRRAFEREARLLNSLRHAALPHVFDYFFEGEGQFLVMQYVPGEDLGHQLKATRQPFPTDTVLKWADQLLDLLDYLHSHEPPIVHRDIKPENLKLTQRGDIILLDFGLAKGSVDQSTQLSTQSLYGYTPHYAPFEQIRGTGTDPRSDLYSLAATLFHLLTGQLPPDALSRAEALMNGEPDPLGQLASLLPMVSPGVSSVLATALATRKEQRYPSAAAMRDALRHAAASPSPSGWAPSPALPRTDPTQIASNPRPTLPPTAAVPPSQSSSVWVFAALGVLVLLAAAVVGMIFVLPRLREPGGQNVANANVESRNASNRSPVNGEAKVLSLLGSVAAEGKVLGLALAADGKLMASSDDAKMVELWDAATGASVRTFGGNKTPSRTVAISPDGSTIAAGYDDGTVCVWRTNDGALIRTAKAHDDFVFLVVFNEVGSKLATAGGDRRVRIWDAASGAMTGDIESPDNDTLIVSVSPDLGRVAYYDSKKGVSIWSVPEKRKVSTLAGHRYDLRSGAFSPDGKTLALGSTDGMVRFWNVADGSMLREIRASSGTVAELTWSPDGQLLATGASDGMLALWNTADGSEMRSAAAHKSSVTSLAFSGDGSTLASASNDKLVRLWLIGDK